MRRHWTTHEISRLKELHGKVHPGVIGRELGRTPHAVQSMAVKLGITFDRRAEMGPEFESLLRDMKARGYSDADVAAEWGAHVDTVMKHRQRLGLPTNIFSARNVEKRRKGLAMQLREAGAKSLAEVKALAMRLRALDRGWGNVSQGEANVLDQLESGPMTRRMILEGMGKPWLGFESEQGFFHIDCLRKKGIVVVCGRKSHEVVYTLAPGVRRRKEKRGVAA